MREDKEIREFRDLMKAPDTYESGFGWGTVLMALFVGLVMAPANLYMGLVAGAGVGGAAPWVTVILYVEITRRAFHKLRRPEIFVLFYMCGVIMSTGGAGLMWTQFVPQSEQIRKMGITEFIPSWYAPTDPAVLAERSFLMAAWLKPLGLTLIMMVISRIDAFGLGYIMYRITSDVEKLPFPMAPVGAMGMTALADASSQQETWRWRTFSVGAAVGVVFGFVYLAFPQITGTLFTRPITIIPQPFIDLTSYTERILPAVAMLVSFNLAAFVTGLVVPFWGAMGTMIGLVCMLIANPLMRHYGILSGWEEGIGGIQTMMSNTMDFYLSFGIGLTVALAIIGFIHVARSFRQKRSELDELGTTGMNWRNLFRGPAGRGDIPFWAAVVIYFFSTTCYITLAYWLVNYGSGPLAAKKFPLWILIMYGFVYTPVISYVSARMQGMIGMPIGIPYVREATFILSGYKGAAVWFAPFPATDYGGQTVFFRTTELTGTKFTSIIKAEVLTLPILFAGMIVFSQFIWSMGPVPSEMFPYANQYWELNAYSSALMWSATLPGEAASPFLEALKPEYVVLALVLALTIYATLAHFSMPTFLIYGIIGGLSTQDPSSVIPLFLGALFGRFFFRKRFGEKWPQYRIVFAAGFGAGVGLIILFGLGFVLMGKSAIRLPV